MEKLYTNKDYADKAVEANIKGEMLYIYVHNLEFEVDVLEFNDVEKEVQQLVTDENGEPILDENGFYQDETVTVTVQEPLMETVEIPNPYAGETYIEIDAKTGEEKEVIQPDTITVTRQKSHKETMTKEVAELLIAPTNYYICYQENYTHKEVNPNYESDIEKAEKKRIANLNLTGADVERGIYQAKGLDFEDIIAIVQEKSPEKVKPLKIELKANHFYRGNPYVEVIGKMLGFTDKQLTMFFETNDYHYLTNCTITINPTPVEATVTINDVIGNKATVPFSTTLVWSVSAEGYKPQDGRLEIGEDTEYNIVLEKEEVLDDSTTDKKPNTNADEVPKKNL